MCFTNFFTNTYTKSIIRKIIFSIINNKIFTNNFFRSFNYFLYFFIFSARIFLFGAAKARDTAIFTTYLGTGIRVSEVQYITVEAVKYGEAVVSLKGKTRSVFIVRELQKKLLRYAAKQKIKTGAIFVTRNGKVMSRTNIWREMKNLCTQAGVNPQKVFPHNLRHLFARTFYGIEKDIAKLADILGHSSIDTTRIYIITTGAEHKRKMEKMKLII